MSTLEVVKQNQISHLYYSYMDLVHLYTTGDIIYRF